MSIRRPFVNVNAGLEWRPVALLCEEWETMTRSVKTQTSGHLFCSNRFFSDRFASAAFAAALAVSGLVSVALADAPLPASATAVRNAIIAMALADAAMPVAVAASVTRDERAGTVPSSSAAMVPETSAAMASMKVASARNPNTGYSNIASSNRRVRPYRDPFLLILGVAY